MEFDLARRMGITVVEVPGLDVDIAYVARHHVALVKEGLPSHARCKAADWVIAEATRATWIPRPTS